MFISCSFSISWAHSKFTSYMKPLFTTTPCVSIELSLIAGTSLRGTVRFLLKPYDCSNPIGVVESSWKKCDPAFESLYWSSSSSSSSEVFLLTRDVAFDWWWFPMLLPCLIDLLSPLGAWSRLLEPRWRLSSCSLKRCELWARAVVCVGPLWIKPFS